MLRNLVLTHPALLALLYALAPLSLAYLNGAGTNVFWSSAYAVVVSVILAIISIGWPAAALYLLKREKSSSVETIRKNKGFLFLGVFLLGAVISISAFYMSEIGVIHLNNILAENLKELLGLAFVVTLFAFFWSVSSAVVDAENEKSSIFLRKVAGFLAVFYFVIGIFFLSPRLKRILSNE